MLGIVLVNYKTNSRTVRYVKNELSKISTPWKLVIVNNSCTDETNQALADRCNGQIIKNEDTIHVDSSIFVIGHKDNLGYAKGNNLGAAFLDRHFKIEYYLFTNNDIRLVDKDVIERLIEKVQHYEDVAAIGPRIVGLDGQDQNPGKFLSIWQRYIFKFGLYPISYFFYNTGWFNEIITPNSEGFCYRLAGCFFLVKANYFQQVQGFDPVTFLYGEELILAEKLSNSGYRQYYVPTVSIIHEHSQTIDTFLNVHKKAWTMFESNSYYYMKYLGQNIVSIEIARASLALYLYCYFPIVKLLKRLLAGEEDSSR